eukprot:GHVP01038688.1.p1 GENE.GHVP01038688.1~~GHVP01038688.1.p1  ORF type:complete len:146 (+),score=7.51 GHVP01038688.1:282-719(+)
MPDFTSTTQVLKTLDQFNWTISKNKLIPQPAPVKKLGYEFGNERLFPLWTSDTIHSISHTINYGFSNLATWQSIIGIINIFRPATPYFAQVIHPLLRHLKKSHPMPPDEKDLQAIQQLHNILPSSHASFHRSLAYRLFPAIIPQE